MGDKLVDTLAKETTSSLPGNNLDDCSEGDDSEVESSTTRDIFCNTGDATFSDSTDKETAGIADNAFNEADDKELFETTDPICKTDCDSTDERGDLVSIGVCNWLDT